MDAANNMIETNTVQWIAPSKSTSRDQEVLQGAKNLPSVVQLEQHTLKLAAPDANLEADCGSALQLQWCLQRRALSPRSGQAKQLGVPEQVDISAAHHNECATSSRAWQDITLEQLVKADKQLWTEIARAHTGGVVAAVGQNEPPLDEHVLRLRNDPRVTMYLLPLPVMGKSDSKCSRVVGPK